jgi:4-hydroxy-tetrahydrodipicolinate reductase
MTRIAILGASGRMGRRIAALAIESEQFDIVAALESPGHPSIGEDIGQLAGVGAFGVKVSDSLGDASPEVLIDFSLPEGTMAWLEPCRQAGTAMVIGTTGLTESQQASVVDASRSCAIVHAGNYSVGINLLVRLVAEAARVLGGEYDCEIAETHHRFKKDAPSGTAIMLAKSICTATGREYGQAVTLGRGGHCPRQAGEIGVHALRVGDTVGEHEVHFGNLGETITLAHSAHTRDTFVRGALRAATWLVGKDPGMYEVADVLGL